MTAPLAHQWDGVAMRPLYPRAADRLYTVGEVYNLAPVEDRSMRSHRHYFAALHEAWANLPFEYGDKFPTVEHLRKWALIKAGYRDERSIVCSSRAEALRVAAFVKPMDEYAVIVARDAVVMVLTAKSQQVKAMGKADFQKSKDEVLGIVADLAGTTAAALMRNAEEVAA